MSATSTRLALLGLPGTGKSTFIGTLWHFVEEPSVAEVEEAALPGDRRHVQALADAVRALVDIDRTKHDADERFDVPVLFDGVETARLLIPDRSGEQLQALVERREWPRLLAEEIDEADALLLFVHPATVRQPLSLSMLPPQHDREPKLASGVAEPSAASDVDGAAPNASALTDDETVAAVATTGPGPEEYSNHLACTAAQLVDALENILEAMEQRWPVRVAVVVSAFDMVEGRTPAEWLAERLPAVGAFLRNNRDRARWTVFGVSAQGGEREPATLELGELHERAWARSADGQEVVLSEPVRWALGWR